MNILMRKVSSITWWVCTGYKQGIAFCLCSLKDNFPCTSYFSHNSNKGLILETHLKLVFTLSFLCKSEFIGGSTVYKKSDKLPRNMLNGPALNAMPLLL